MTGRDREMDVVRAVLRQARDAPALLIVDGVAGIGKTTLCRAAAAEAEAAGFSVISAAGVAAEMSLAWAGLADLAAGLDDDTLRQLSPLHRQALEALAGGLGVGGDERLPAAAFKAAVQLQSRTGPVLLVVDDAQWLDPPSRVALGYTVRRLSGPVAVLIAHRTGEPGGADHRWAQPPDPQALTRLTLGPMSPDEVHDMLAARSGQTPSRPALERIDTLAGGNPFYALELARAIEADPAGGLDSLPPTLAGLIRQLLGDPDPAAASALLTAAVAFEPTVDLLAAAEERSPADVVEILQPLERRGVLALDGTRIRFTHPLIPGFVTETDPALTRRAHRRLAALVEHPEQRARHLALGNPHGDPETLAALDAAAESAAGRSAYSTAAELVDMAISLGGDTDLRRLRGGEFHFRAGALDEADQLVAPIVDDLPAGFLRTAGLLLVAAVRGYRDGLASTIGMLERAVAEAGEDPVLRTQALIVLALSVGIGGDMQRCVELARRARADAETTGLSPLRSQALTLWAHVSFMYGLGTDFEALDEALDLREPDAIAPIMLRPRAIRALHWAWTGRLEEARAELAEVSRQCDERGNELDVLWAAEQLTMIDVGLGRYDDAARTAADAVVRAELIGGQLPMITARTAVADAAAHLGRLEDTRAAADRATEAAAAARLGYLIRPPLMSLAFAQVSDGQYEQALETLKPLLAGFDAAHDTEIVAGGFIPDAVEALTATGRVEDAESLTAALESAGHRHDRPWALAVGARCRALVQNAAGDHDAALRSAERALAHHDRLPMPFERARTELLIGQLQRRRRRTPAAHAALSRAAAAFEEIGSPLWAARAHRELARITARSEGAPLSDSERQAAGYAAAGMTNKEIAAAMFAAEKTIEMYLSSVYRKFGIRSRTQLRERLGELGPAEPQP